MSYSPNVIATDASAGAAPNSLRARFARLATIVRRIVGVPDYGVYVAHMARHHPECVLLDKRTFERERLADRYSRPGSRCC